MFTISLDQLHEGRKLTLKENLEPSFLEVSEKDLLFPEDIAIEGEAYLAESDLIFHVSIQTTVHLPCSICNRMTPVPIKLLNFYHTEPIKNIALAFDFRNALREAILLEVPSFAECNEGQCKERENLSHYMAKEKKEQNAYPFKDL